MKRKNMFKNLSIDDFWLPLTQQIADNHNYAIKISNNDDEKYCKIMMVMSSLLMNTYGKYVDLYRFNQVFIYIMEFIFGDPYKESKPGDPLKNTIISTREMFELIKKYWNVNINKELQRVKNGNKKSI